MGMSVERKHGVAPLGAFMRGRHVETKTVEFRGSLVVDVPVERIVT